MFRGRGGARPRSARFRQAVVFSNRIRAAARREHQARAPALVPLGGVGVFPPRGLYSGCCGLALACPSACLWLGLWGLPAPARSVGSCLALVLRLCPSCPPCWLVVSAAGCCGLFGLVRGCVSLSLGLGLGLPAPGDGVPAQGEAPSTSWFCKAAQELHAHSESGHVGIFQSQGCRASEASGGNCKAAGCREAEGNEKERARQGGAQVPQEASNINFGACHCYSVHGLQARSG